MASSIEIDVSANIAKFKASMDKAAIEGNKLNKRLDRAFKGVSNAMRSVGALAGVAVAGGLGAMAKSAINSADAIQKLGIRTGASAGFLSEMRYALSQNDVAMKDFEGALRKINKSSQEAGDGLSTQVRAFDKLGISVKAFQALGTDDKFKVLSEAISRVEDPAIRTQVAMDIMGRSGEQLLTVMQNGAGGIEEYLVKARDLNMTLSQEQVDSAAAANDAIDTLTKSFSGAATQSILQYSDEIARAADLTREYLPKAISAVIEVFKIATPAVLAFYTTLKLLTFAPPMFAAISASAVAMGGGLTVASVATGTLTVAISALKAGLLFLTGPVGIALAVGSLVGLAFHFKETEKSTSDLRAELDLLKSGNMGLADSMNKVSMASVDQSIEALRKQYEGLNSDLRLNLITFGQFDDRLAELDERASVLVETKKHLIGQINKTRDSLSKGVTATKLSWEEYKKSKEVLTQYTGEIDEATKSQIKFLKVSTQTFEEYRNANSRGVIENFGNSLNEASAELYNTQQNQDLFNQALKDGVISGELAEKMASSLGVEYEGLGEKTSIVSDAWEDANRKIFDSMQTFFRDGLDGWDNFGDSVKDIVKDMIASILSQIVALLAANAFKQLISFVSGGKYFSGASWSDGFSEMFGGSSTSGKSNLSGGTTGGFFQDIGKEMGFSSTQTDAVLGGAAAAFTLYNGYNQIKNGNEISGAVQLGSGAIQGYNAYQNFTGGAEYSGMAGNYLGAAGNVFGIYGGIKQGGAMGYGSAALNAYQLYGAGQAAGWWGQAANASTFGNTLATTPYAQNLVNPNFMSYTDPGLNIANQGVSQTGNGLSWLGKAGAVAGVAGGVYGMYSGIEQGGARGAATFGAGAIGAYAGTAALTGGASAVLGAMGPAGWAAMAVLALAGMGGARDYDQILQEDYLPDLLGQQGKGHALGANGETGFNGGNTAVFGANWGIQGSGLTAQHLVDGGENGNGGFFTGAQRTLDGFEEALRAAGFESLNSDFGTLRVLDKDKNVADIMEVWETYAAGLEEAVGYNEVFQTAIENGLVSPSNLFFENFATGFGQSAFEARDSLIAIDGAFDEMVKGGMTKTDALFKSMSDHYGLALEDAQYFVEQSGVSAEQFIDNFSNYSDSALSQILDFNADGVTGFKNGLAQMGEQAESTFNQIEQRINGVSVAAQNSAGNVVNAYDGAYDRVQGLDDAFSRRLLQKLDQITDNSSVTRGNSQPLAGI